MKTLATNKIAAVKISKKEFNATLIAERHAQIACCNGKVNHFNDIIAAINDGAKMQDVKACAEWRTVTNTLSNGLRFSNGSRLDYQAGAEYYRAGNVVIVVNVSEVEDFDENYNRVNIPYYNVMAYLIDAPETAPAQSATAESTTPANAATTTPAAKCLTMHLDNTAEIYNRYTAPAIAELVNKDRNNGGRTNWGNVISALCTLDPCEPFRTLEGKICRAIDHARRLVHQLDGLTPTTADIEQAAHDYVAYIVECAQYENANA